MTTPAAGEWHGREHRLPVRVYYEDTDFTGVVFHGAHVRYFERGRTDALRLIGIGHTAMKSAAPPLAFAVVRLEIDYRRPAAIDDALEVCTTMSAMKGALMVVDQKIVRGEDLIAQARVEVAVIGADGRPHRPSKQMREALQQKLF